MPKTLSPPLFDKLQARTLRARIAEQVRGAILSGALKPGDRIVERSLAGQLGASLTAVREALVELEGEGLIVKRPNATTCVAMPTAAQIAKIFEVRNVLEPFAVELAARHATPGQVAKLEGFYLGMVDAARRHNIAAYLEKDFAWHELVWTMTDNEYLRSALKRMLLPMFTLKMLLPPDDASVDWVGDAISHRAILKAIKSRDAKAARAALLSATAKWQSNTHNFVARGGAT